MDRFFRKMKENPVCVGETEKEQRQLIFFFFYKKEENDDMESFK
jgi:hypothetical protein